MLKKLAICIGNDNYKGNQKLKCAVNDATAVSEKLKALGFEVLLHINLDNDNMQQAVVNFERMLSEYDVGLFYFAGHGFEHRGENILIPIDMFDFNIPDLRFWNALNLKSVIEALDGKNVENSLKFKIIILDACRQVPDIRGGGSKGFGSVVAPTGSIIAFSTSPGKLSMESDMHGYYTKALLQNIDTPRVSIEDMFKSVRQLLANSTRGQQISWEHTSLMGKFSFNEDRIDSEGNYSKNALADKKYYFDEENEIGKIVAALKSKDWYAQNPAILEINKINFAASSANDLFVLGRNIYQSANGGAGRAESFVSNFQNNRYIGESAKRHILNGMAFEIYFDKKGLLRFELKAEYYLDIIKFLEEGIYQASKNFIADMLSEVIENRIIYIPDSERRYDMVLVCEKEQSYNIFNIKQILLNGKNILFSDEGKYTSPPLSQIEMKKQIAKAMAAPPNLINFQCDSRVTKKMDGQSKFILPYSFQLRY